METPSPLAFYMPTKEIRAKYTIEIPCADCGAVMKKYKYEKIFSNPPVCKRCWTLSINVSGPNAPGYKHGKYAIDSRHGTDKNGLRWVDQRALCQKRDKETCQICRVNNSTPLVNKNRKGNYKRIRPDCHHIIPWSKSNDHSLKNLICLCMRCHYDADTHGQDTGVYLFLIPFWYENEVIPF